VAGIAQRKDVVSGLFLFLCLWAFLRWRESRRAGWYAAALVALPLALLAKATAVVAPALLVLLVLPELRRDRRVLLELAPFAAIAGGMAFLSMRVAAGAGTLHAAERPVLAVALTFAKVAFHYLRMLILGGPLTIMHDLEPVRTAADPVGLAALAGLLALAGVLTAAARRWPLVALGGAWFLVAIVPVAGLVPAPNLAADRYLFIPALGAALAAASAIVELAGSRWPAAVVPATAALLVLAGGRTVARAEDWRTNERLLVTDLRANPASLRLTTSLGRYYFVNGRLDLAFEHFERARALQPSDPELDLFTALRLLQLGDGRGALAALDRIAAGASIVDVQCLYGMVHEAEGRPAEAATAYRRALAANQVMGVLFKRDAQAGLGRVATESGAGR
jgi:tetratricopeptide (TPR) repeat protein